MNVGRIRGFLLQLPKPATIRVTRDGETTDIKPNKSAARTAETIAALAPELIECLDASGSVLRAQSTDTPEAHRSEAAAIPDGIKGDPNALMLTHFANLLHRAYEHSTETAFVRLVEITERMNDRSQAIEQRLERTEAANRRLLQDQVDAAFERAEEVAEEAAEQGSGGDLMQQMAAAFMSGQRHPPAPRPNGAPKVNGTPSPKGQA